MFYRNIMVGEKNSCVNAGYHKDISTNTPADQARGVYTQPHWIFFSFFKDNASCPNNMPRYIPKHLTKSISLKLGLNFHRYKFDLNIVSFAQNTDLGWNG